MIWVGVCKCYKTGERQVAGIKDGWAASRMCVSLPSVLNSSKEPKCLHAELKEESRLWR